MVSKGYKYREINWFYESSCKIFVRQTLSRVNICDSYVYFLLDIHTILSRRVHVMMKFSSHMAVVVKAVTLLVAP